MRTWNGIYQGKRRGKKGFEGAKIIILHIILLLYSFQVIFTSSIYFILTSIQRRYIYANFTDNEIEAQENQSVLYQTTHLP